MVSIAHQINIYKFLDRKAPAKHFLASSKILRGGRSLPKISIQHSDEEAVEKSFKDPKKGNSADNGGKGDGLIPSTSAYLMDRREITSEMHGTPTTNEMGIIWSSI
ncbi:hypothetical protein DI09_30p80 [Mitosporidium daphniae]|uniref:Uncharacterized protein n=1 Tax=Mitosporidium daphniae TaxID=1485682 RepID=A0A098VRD3_9MICR|nr:uncharacterized protein DI09_30p80 [Mitosporidium daphniae]KGG51592.1 hypothetical protein DI09_30p80 [Mitosporidium daphniae]|eukprot:XP_013238050.1 uncharacterized protein DI09_30p80 [Mitosporidium daphniae]